MANEDYFQKFGYTEMYEWAETPLNKYGLFVEFDPDEPTKILPYHLGGKILGITSITSLTISDDPDEWKCAYLVNDVGDLYLKDELLAVGTKEYDQHLEMSYIHTRPWKHYVKVPYDKYDPSRKYVKRTNRAEWVKVNLIGKCIVVDDGTCTPGGYCRPYVGNDKAYWGHAVESRDIDDYYVLQRLTDTTILIVNK